MDNLQFVYSIVEVSFELSGSNAKSNYQKNLHIKVAST